MSRRPRRSRSPTKQKSKRPIAAAASSNDSIPQFEGTVKGPNKSDFDSEKASQRLRKAFKGLGTDEKIVIDVIGSHTNWQRQEIKKKYKTMYGRDLINDMEDELGGHFLDAALALMCPTHLYDAHCIRKAIVGVGADENCLIDILCSKSNSELELIKEAYYQEFRRNLEKDLGEEASGDFSKFLRSLVTANREENGEVDIKLAERDAAKLQGAGVNKLGTDEEVFNQIICLRSWLQLRSTFECYRKRTDRDIETDIRKEFSGEIREGLLAIVRIVKNPQAYFAEKIYESMRGTGTDDETLIRLTISRSEIDLAQIKEEYQRRYKKTLAKAIREDCSGDYARLLLKIIG